MITTIAAAKTTITDPMVGATSCRLVATNVKSGRTYSLDSMVAPISFHAELLAQITAVPSVGNWHFGVCSWDARTSRPAESLAPWSRSAHAAWMGAHDAL